MKSALRQDIEADLISSKAARRRFHPSLLGFHRATHDFILFGSVAGFEPPHKPFFAYQANRFEKCVIDLNCFLCYNIAIKYLEN